MTDPEETKVVAAEREVTVLAGWMTAQDSLNISPWAASPKELLAARPCGLRRRVEAGR